MRLKIICMIFILTFFSFVKNTWAFEKLEILNDTKWKFYNNVVLDENNGTQQVNNLEIYTKKNPSAKPVSGVYSYGVQFGYDKSDWEFTFDLKSKSDLMFGDIQKVFEYLNFSARAQKGEALNYSSVEIKSSQDFFRVGIDSQRKISEVTFKNAVYYKDDSVNSSDFFGGYLFVGYQPLRRVEFHSQIDGKKNINGSFAIFWTSGVKFLFSDVEFTTDYVREEGGNDKAQVLLKFNF